MRSDEQSVATRRSENGEERAAAERKGQRSGALEAAQGGEAAPLVYVPQLDAKFETCSDQRKQSRAHFGFSTPEEVHAAVSDISNGTVWKHEIGGIPHVEVGPGYVRLGETDMEKQQARSFREQDNAIADMVMATKKGAFEHPDKVLGLVPSDAESGFIRSWSARSRARMVRTIAGLDLVPLVGQVGTLAMLTLTYPGGAGQHWLETAPDGRTVKKHLEAFRMRYKRAWGEPLSCIWKMEFQRRGAPHYHILMTIPDGQAADPMQDYAEKMMDYEDAKRAGEKVRKPYKPRAVVGAGMEFQDWVRYVWTDIVDDQDPVERAKHQKPCRGTQISVQEFAKANHPRKVAAYFSKHGSFASKDYQNTPPKEWRDQETSVGRFWGYWGLKFISESEVVTRRTYTLTSRVLKKVSRTYRNKDGVQPTLKRTRKARRIREADGSFRVLRDVEGNLLRGPRGEIVFDLKWRWTTERRNLFKRNHGAGWLMVDDGPQFTRQIARWTQEADAPAIPAVGLRGDLAGRLKEYKNRKAQQNGTK